MLIGVFVHTSTIGFFGPVEVVVQISNMFRMALFFIISGYLGGLLLSKQTPRAFWIGRFRNLFVPLVFGIIVLNPPTIYFMYAFFHEPLQYISPSRYVNIDGADSMTGKITWHLHLWFLVSLIAYALAAPLLLLLAKRFVFVLQSNPIRDSKFTQVLCIFSIVFSVLGLMLSLEVVELFFGSLPWILKATVLYLPYYIMGLVVFSYDGVRENITTPNYIFGTIIFVAYFSSLYLPPSGPAGTLMEIISLSFVRSWLCFFIIYLGSRILNYRNRITDIFSRSIYTIYLIHYGAIYGLALLFKDAIPANSVLLYIVISSLTIFIGLLFHHFIVLKSSWVSYIMNGRVLKSAS
jgi:glucan biosynthesis protein C